MSDNKKDLQEKLSPEEYYVTQNQGTEPAFSGKYDGVKTPGTYHCIVCDVALFSSESKYDSDQVGLVFGSHLRRIMLKLSLIILQVWLEQKFIAINAKLISDMYFLMDLNLLA